MNIVTRGDFDGLICSVLLTKAETIAQVRLVHPKAMQDNAVPVGSDDIIVNLPYHADCGMWFDHHITEQTRGEKPDTFVGKYGLAPSCARLIADYYNLPEWENEKYQEMLRQTDNIDSANLTLADIMTPEGWVRLANTVDPRTGFRADHAYFLHVIELIHHKEIKEILEDLDVHERVSQYFAQHDRFEKELKANTQIEGKVAITDFRRQIEQPVGSRFLVYALYPAVNVSVRLFYLDDREHVVICVGHSILNRTCKVDVGSLMAEYGGGGHVGAGTFRVLSDVADDALSDVVDRLNFAQ